MRVNPNYANFTDDQEDSDPSASGSSMKENVEAADYTADFGGGEDWGGDFDEMLAAQQGQGQN